MKKLITILGLLFSTFCLHGQDIIITGGGAGHFTLGTSMLINNKVTDYLKEPHVLGSSFPGSLPALQIGGEGYAMINKFIVGGGGFALGGFESRAGEGFASIGGAAGYFKAGYRVWTRETSFLTASSGFGAFGYQLELKNESAENGVGFNKLSPISIGEKRSYNFGSALFDLSLGFKKMILGSKDARGFGGFLAGVDAGCLLIVPVKSWKSDMEPVISGPPDPGLTAAPYLRVTFGGGGFNYRN